MADLIGVPTNAPQLLTPVRPQSDQLQWSLIRRLLQAEKILESRSAPGPDRMAAAAHADLPLALRVPTYSVALPSPPFSSRYAAHHSNKYQLSLLDHLSQVRRARHQPTRHRRSRAVFPEDRLAVPRSGTPECRRADPVTSTNRVGRRNWRQTDHSLRHTRRCAKRPLHYCCGQISIVGQPLRPLTANKCRHREQPYHRVGSLFQPECHPADRDRKGLPVLHPASARAGRTRRILRNAYRPLLHGRIPKPEHPQCAPGAS